MAREHFDEDLRQLSDDVVRIGSMVERMTRRAATALIERQVPLAEQVIGEDSQVDALAFATEHRALTIIATQQPVAHDLRCIAGAIVITHELERIGDHAEGIAKLTRRLGREAPLPIPADMARLAEAAVRMIAPALRAYIDEDEELARSVWEMDDAVDALYNQIYRELLAMMTSDSTLIEGATRLLHAAHDLERVGDRVTNICERVCYIVNGQISFVRRPATQSLVNS